MSVAGDMTTSLAGTAMLVLALALPCAGDMTSAIRLGMAHAMALALAVAAHGAGGRPVLLLLAAVVLAKVLALPWLLARDARARGEHRPLAILAVGTVLAALAWVALPPVAGMRPVAIPLALAMLALGILPALLGQGAARRFLGLLVAADGAVLAALALPNTMHVLLLELGVLGLLGALLLTLRREPGASRAVS